MAATRDSLIAEATARFAAIGIDNPALDARWLIDHVLQNNSVDDAALKRIETMIARRSTHEPVARIIGNREFWSLEFGLNEATLEPRPDSETLVEVALKNLHGKKAPRLLDLGTGTGCLLLSLLHELPEAKGVGIDKAQRAIEQATLNAKNLNLASRASFQQGDWLQGITEKFDAIISNPPYIPSSIIPTLMPDVRNYDPMLALDGGADGLNVYRLLVPQVPAFLKPEGFIIFEVGIHQADDVAELCRSADLTNVTKHKDLGGIERCVVGFKAV